MKFDSVFSPLNSMSFILYSFISLCDVIKSVVAVKVMLTVLADDILFQ